MNTSSRQLIQQTKIETWSKKFLPSTLSVEKSAFCLLLLTSLDIGKWNDFSFESLQKVWQLTPVFLPGKSHGRRNLVGVHGVAKSQTRLSDFTFTFHFHALEKEMATHSSVLAWRIQGTAEPCGLPSMGSHRVRHDWSNLAVAAAAT